MPAAVVNVQASSVITDSKIEKKARQSKNAHRRAKKKAEKSVNPQESTGAGENGKAESQTQDSATNGIGHTEASKSTWESKPEQNDDDLDYDQIGTIPGVSSDDPLYAQFQAVLDRFAQDKKQGAAEDEATEKGAIFYEDDNDDIPDEEQEAHQKLSKRKRKAVNKLSVAELKSIVRRPELVEWTDTSAPDPRLLISIKGARNVVPVPTHWALKREYLSSKRGVEKQRFALPKFIIDTGIADMRDAALEAEAEKSLKQKQRERVAPKMGKLDIDYQKFYEAFFKHQTKPELTRYGEVYYEGKEYETNMRHLRPGEMSDGLHEALGMAHGTPPPWLLNMQRWGPPLSYPNLKVPGVNAPIPPGARWGYGPNEWGKALVDEQGHPQFGGDLFGSLLVGGDGDGVGFGGGAGAGTAAPPPPPPMASTAAGGYEPERTLWGELQTREEESEEEAEEEEEDEGDDGEGGGAGDSDGEGVGGREGPAFDRNAGLASTVPTEIGGVESIGGEFSLRKPGSGVGGSSGLASGTATSEGGAPTQRQAYQVLDERAIRNEGFFGGERAYDLSQARPPVLGQQDQQRGGGSSRKRKAVAGVAGLVGDIDVAVALDPDAVGEGPSQEEIRRRYEQGRKELGGWKGRAVDQDDLSDMIAEEGRKRARKDAEDRERRRQGGGRR